MKLTEIKHLEKLSGNLLIIISGGQEKKKKKNKKDNGSVKKEVYSDSTDTQKNDSFNKIK